LDQRHSRFGAQWKTDCPDLELSFIWDALLLVWNGSQDSANSSVERAFDMITASKALVIEAVDRGVETVLHREKDSEVGMNTSVGQLPNMARPSACLSPTLDKVRWHHLVAAGLEFTMETSGLLPGR
jgi:hypothetical protein